VRRGTISGPKSAERRLKRPFRCYFPSPASYLSKRLGSIYRRGRSPHWVKVKNPNAPTVKRRAEENWSPLTQLYCADGRNVE
jgi:hypothetical protein